MEVYSDTSIKSIDQLGKRNILMNIMSLTLYRFWARSNTRQFLWASTRIDGEPLHYNGNGEELFKGFWLAIIGIFGPMWLILKISSITLTPQELAILVLFGYLALAFISGVGIYRARAYILSRTSWRGIGFSLSKGALSFSWRFLLHNFMLIITLGWWHPTMRVRVSRFLWSRTSWGNIKFEFDKSNTPLYEHFIPAWFGFIIASLIYSIIIKLISLLFVGIETAIILIISSYIVSLGYYILIRLCFAEYNAVCLQMITRSIKINGCSLNLTIDGFDFFKLSMTNMFLTVISLGTLSSYTSARYWKYIIDHMEITTPIDNYDNIHVPTAEIDGKAEGITDAWELPYFDMSPV